MRACHVADLSPARRRAGRTPGALAAARAAVLGVTLGAVAAVAAAPARGWAQQGASAAAEEAAGALGSVLDAEVRGAGGAAVVGAQVSVTPARTAPGVVFARGGVTGDDGRVRLAGLPPGRATLAVRRIGYRPASLEISLPAADAGPLVVTLDAVPQQLAAVVVRANRRGRYTGPLADFQRRRDMGFGRFITAEEIDRRQVMRTTDLLRTLPGVAVVSNGMTARLRVRGNTCDPFVWIDGSPASAGYFDVDVFAPQSLAGIEVYSGAATVPVELRGARGESSCGVIALWSRLPDPQTRRPRKPVTAEELAALVAAATVYTADQVDRAAQLDTTVGVDLAYPDSLRRHRVSGEALVEFVVDTAGRVEVETVGVVAATHPRFGDAARAAARTARFLPAERAGRRVRQLAQLPLRWEGGR